MIRLALVVSVLPIACGTPRQPAPAAPSGDGEPAQVAALEPPAAMEPVEATPQAERMESDTPRATTAGSTFTVPAGWSIATRDSEMILEPPEPGSRLALIEVVGVDADAAVAAAWKVYQTGEGRAVRLATDRPARDGWLEVREYEYETSPNEKRVVRASALRHEGGWLVAILDFDAAVRQRWLGPMLVVFDTLRPAGFDFGEWHSAVASRVNDDGTISFILIDPGHDFADLVVGSDGGARTLTLRDAQHEYVFVEAREQPSPTPL